MTQVSFTVVFQGQLLQGAELGQVKQRFASRFNVKPDRLNHFFSGEPVVLKAGLDKATADRLVCALQGIGAACRVVPVKPEPHQEDKTAGHWESDRPSMAAVQPLVRRPRMPQLEHAVAAPWQVGRDDEVAGTQEAHTEDDGQAPSLYDPKASFFQDRKKKDQEKSFSKVVHHLGCIGVVGAILITLSVGAIYLWRQHRGITHSAGILIHDEPLQVLTPDQETFVHNGYTIHPVANFELSARVLSTKRYKEGRISDLVPIDLALGWGPMSDTAVIEQIKISQSNRFYFYRVSPNSISLTLISHNSSNMHMIPANKKIFSQLKALRKGALIHLTGELVNVRAADGYFINTSLKRDDTGAGACEVFFLKQIEQR